MSQWLSCFVCEALAVAADVLQLAALLCPPSSVSLASFGALLAHLPLLSLSPPPSPSPTPCSLPAAKGAATRLLALYLQVVHAALCFQGKLEVL